tara:strand:- start:2003 stop:2347 length:345 start_codon:yes stop_codon:yes gene_type:complete
MGVGVIISEVDLAGKHRRFAFKVFFCLCYTTGMSDKKYDAVLVLGGGINLNGSLPDITKEQVQKSVDLFKASSAEAFITSGLYGYKGTEKPVISEARAYAKYAESLGVPSTVFT